MLTKKEQEEINNELKLFPAKKFAIIEALSIVQNERGWISDEALKDIAGYLEVSNEAVEGVATFYNLVYRKPVGRHIIHVCDSISCYVMGYENIAKTLKDKLGIEFGETSEDNRFTLLTIPCLGNCDHAPAMLIDGNLHNDLKPEDLDDVLNDYE
jgi:NADH-quinone oxidoreductase subunit E